MNKCINCQNLIEAPDTTNTESDIFYNTEKNTFVYFVYKCGLNGQTVKHPFFMGGSKKCECYKKITIEKKKEKKNKFIYPKKKIPSPPTSGSNIIKRTEK